MKELTCENVRNIFEDCLFKTTEIINGEPCIKPIKVEGIIQNFGFHPKRLELHKEEIKELLNQLPINFKESNGGGWSFLKACHTRDGHQWGEHSNMEQLFVLGIGVGLARYCMPREMWKILPGQMPYITILGE